MIYRPANNSGIFRLRAAGYPVGMLMCPTDFRVPSQRVAGRTVWLPFAIDNGLYHAEDRPPKPPAERGFIYAALAKVETRQWPPPLFAVVPDVPYGARATYRELSKHAPLMRELFPRVPLALAVQDGMSPGPACTRARRAGCSWIFLGGSTAWKERTATAWVAEAAAHGLSAHYGRASGHRIVERAKAAGYHSPTGPACGEGASRGGRRCCGRWARSTQRVLPPSLSFNDLIPVSLRAGRKTTYCGGHGHDPRQHSGIPAPPHHLSHHPPARREAGHRVLAGGSAVPRLGVPVPRHGPPGGRRRAAGTPYRGRHATAGP